MQIYRILFLIPLLTQISLLGSEAHPQSIRETIITLQSGEIPADAKLKSYVQYNGIEWPESNQQLDLAMKLVVLKLETGIPLQPADISRYARYQGSGGKVDTRVDYNRSTIRLPNVATERDFGPLARYLPSDFPQNATYGIEPLRLARVIQQNHSGIFQLKNGRYLLIQYGGGIVYTNYLDGALFWLKNDNILTRSQGDQTTQVIRLILLSK